MPATSGTSASCRMQAFPAVMQTFYIREGDAWRAPRVNETCCKRPQLAAFLERVAADGPQPVFQQHAQVTYRPLAP